MKFVDIEGCYLLAIELEGFYISLDYLDTISLKNVFKPVVDSLRSIINSFFANIEKHFKLSYSSYENVLEFQELKGIRFIVGIHFHQ
jgi:hypothetical protein